MPKTDSHVKDLIQSMLGGDKRALARLMTYVDNRHEKLTAIMQKIYPQAGKAYRIGITGPPGAGKSTLVDKLIRAYRSQEKKVGVVAIDPSSPFTGGAVLGDRIRMLDHGSDDGVFIRSLGSRGSHGGLSRATRDIINLMDAFGFDIILVETVGVGQTELDIMNVAHTTVVVLVPESGDTIQTMKAGLMEIADIFVVNKADRDGVDKIYAELKSLSGLSVNDTRHHTDPKDKEEMARSMKEAMIPVFKVEAVNNKGVGELLTEIEKRKLGRTEKKKNGRSDDLLVEESLDIFLSGILTSVAGRLKEGGELKKDYAALIGEHRNPYQTAADLLDRISWKR